MAAPYCMGGRKESLAGQPLAQLTLRKLIAEERKEEGKPMNKYQLLSFVKNFYK